MPRPSAPLTPSASGEITGKDNPAFYADQPFELPPPAVQTKRNVNVRGTGHRPIQPAQNPGHSLPPPPTRSRTIIQMTPKSQPQSATNASPRPPTDIAFRRKRSAPDVTTLAKRHSATTSAAGKKAARKTAHSVIERRRRSKMNEEFATLKELIPACSGQEMHKLAILQVIL